MNAKQIEKHLDKLTAQERAILIVNTFGRGDQTEANRLIDAAPRVNLVAPDCGRVIMRVINAIEWHCLKQVENAASMFLMFAWADEDRAACDPKADFEGDALAATAHNIIARADGWKIFCGELGLDPVGAFKIVAVDVVLLETAECIARAVNPNPNAIWEKLRASFPRFADFEPKTAEHIAVEYRTLFSVGK